MSENGRFGNGQFLTTAEKALVVMVAAGLFGYWAGFNLSIPGLTLGVPVAAVEQSMSGAREPVREAPKVTEAQARQTRTKGAVH